MKKDTQKYFYILFLFLSFFILESCGYKPLLNEKYKQFNIEKYKVSGDKRIAQILINNLGTSKKGSNNLFINVNAKKDRTISNKSTSGKILEYKMSLTFNITVKELIDEKTVLSKKFYEESKYKAATLYLDTLNTEKKIIDSLAEIIANRLLNELSLIYREK